MAKILSLIVAGAYVLVTYLLTGTDILSKIVLFIVLGTACIWFGDPLGRVTGFRWAGNMNVSQETPGAIIKIVGWIVLLLVPAIILVSQ